MCEIVKEIAKHARERALERYGLVITYEDIVELERKIFKGDAFKGRETKEGIVYCVMHDGMAVVVAVKDKKVITFLPPDTFTSGNRKRYFMQKHDYGNKPPHKERTYMSGGVRRTKRL